MIISSYNRQQVLSSLKKNSQFFFSTEKKRKFKLGAQSSSSSFSFTLANLGNLLQVSYCIHLKKKKKSLFLLSAQKVFLEGFWSNRKGLASQQSHEARGLLLQPVGPCDCSLYPGESGGGASEVPSPGSRPRCCCLRGSPFLCVVSPLRQPFLVSF